MRYFFFFFLLLSLCHFGLHAAGMGDICCLPKQPVQGEEHRSQPELQTDSRDLPKPIREGITW